MGAQVADGLNVEEKVTAHRVVQRWRIVVGQPARKSKRLLEDRKKYAQ